MLNLTCHSPIVTMNLLFYMRAKKKKLTRINIIILYFIPVAVTKNTDIILIITLIKVKKFKNHQITQYFAA